jgi:hypothetical protein
VDHCIDSWTDIPLKVPVSGLIPYPAEGAEDPESNMFVTVTPVAMTTLGDTSSSTIRSKYAAAFTKLAVQLPSTANPVHAGAIAFPPHSQVSYPVLAVFLTGFKPIFTYFHVRVCTKLAVQLPSTANPVHAGTSAWLVSHAVVCPGCFFYWLDM